MTTDLFGTVTVSEAAISLCGRYRWWLSRIWMQPSAPVCFLMLNPSTADHVHDDPTITRCVRFAKSWGHGGIVVVNLFAWRATDPSELLKAPDPVGSDNDAHIIQQTTGRRVIVAWGAIPKRHQSRAAAVLKLLDCATSVECLKLTKDGQPWHPLFVRADAVPVPFAVETQS